MLQRLTTHLRLLDVDMGTVRRTVTSVVLSVGFLLAGTSMAVAATSHFITLSPASGLASSSFRINWAGFTECRIISFTWAGAPLTTGSPGTTGSVNTTVPAGAKPGSYVVGANCVDETARAIFTVTVPVTTTTPPPPPTTVPTTVPLPPPTTRRPVTTVPVPPPTTTPAPTTTTPPPTTTVPPTTAGPTGGLILDHGTIQPGDPLSASGAGCQPGHNVTLTSDGEVVGRSVADASGQFNTPIQFTHIEPGRHIVTADCGILLTGDVEQALTSSIGDHSGTLIVLVFFVLAGVVLVRFV
jgi:hypothetical protein